MNLLCLFNYGLFRTSTVIYTSIHLLIILSKLRITSSNVLHFLFFVDLSFGLDRDLERLSLSQQWRSDQSEPASWAVIGGHEL